MKKLLLIVVMTFASMSYASAQWTTYYVTEQVGQEYTAFHSFKIDWTNNYFFLDSDSEDETKCPIKNLKEEGNKKTFDVYYVPTVSTDKYGSVEFTTNDDKSWTLVLILPGQNGTTYNQTFLLSDTEPVDEPAASGNVSSGNSNAKKSPKDVLKGGVNKVTNVFKKKK